MLLSYSFFHTAYRKCETVQDCPDFSHMPDIICNCIKKKCTCFGGNEYHTQGSTQTPWKGRITSLTIKELKKYTLY